MRSSWQDKMVYPLMILNPLAIITFALILFPGKDGSAWLIAVTGAIRNLIADIIIVYAKLDQGRLQRNHVNLMRSQVWRIEKD